MYLYCVYMIVFVNSTYFILYIFMFDVYNTFFKNRIIDYKQNNNFIIPVLKRCAQTGTFWIKKIFLGETWNNTCIYKILCWTAICTHCFLLSIAVLRSLTCLFIFSWLDFIELAMFIILNFFYLFEIFCFAIYICLCLMMVFLNELEIKLRFYNHNLYFGWIFYILFSTSSSCSINEKINSIEKWFFCVLKSTSFKREIKIWKMKLTVRFFKEVTRYFWDISNK